MTVVWYVENRFDVLINRFTILNSTQNLCQGIIFAVRRSTRKTFLLFPMLLDKSPLNSVYFATFEKKREIRSPLPHNQTFWFL